jgi:hypothetical protein
MDVVSMNPSLLEEGSRRRLLEDQLFRCIHGSL